MISIEKIETHDVEAAQSVSSDTTASNKPRYTPEQLITFKNYVYNEIEDALSQRKSQEFSWMQSMRDYEARPKRDVVNIPIEDAPNIVIPLAALAAESVYSIAVDLIFGTSPVLTIRCKDANVSKAIQLLANKLAASPDVNFRSSVEHALLDDVILGTGYFYTPWIEITKKTDINRVKYFGPQINVVPVEDILTRGGSTKDIEYLPWIAFRSYPTEYELKARAKKLDLDIEGVAPAGAVDQVRQTRESLARSNMSGVKMQKTYETYDFYCTYDIDEDGEYEDMLVFFDRTSQRIMKIQFNPYERRPFRKMCYQIRAHQFNGMGVPEMLRYIQEEISTIHNSRTLNMLLANTRMWLSKHGTFPGGNVRVWPNRNIEVSDTNDVKELKLSDIYASEPMAEAADLQLAERRVGSELPMPKPSQLMSSRTPATTTMSMLQQINRRFTPAFNQMRDACAGAIKDCLFRIQEQLLAGDMNVQRWLTDLLDDEAPYAIVALTSPTFDNEVAVELTASSVTVNKDVDRQESLMLLDRLAIYYEKILQLVTIAVNPMTPPQVAEAAKQIAAKSAEVLDRVLRNFDSVRDPQSLIVHVEDQIDQALQGKIQQQQLQQLMMLTGGMSGAQGQPGALPGMNGTNGTAPPNEADVTNGANQQ